jgi:hypothetical protein
MAAVGLAFAALLGGCNLIAPFDRDRDHGDGGADTDPADDAEADADGDADADAEGPVDCELNAGFGAECVGSVCDDGSRCLHVQSDTPTGVCLQTCGHDGSCPTMPTVHVECALRDPDENRYCALLCVDESDCPCGLACTRLSSNSVCAEPGR